MQTYDLSRIDKIKGKTKFARWEIPINIQRKSSLETIGSGLLLRVAKYLSVAFFREENDPRRQV
jgi:hypothetical protein